mmetsp:Transcript_6967/g.19703  ORF Transcript_6967/g.19703 Transcript_6967/m.19703 type:complete len:488 (+) Transcript_6967:468-1931(+)
MGHEARHRPCQRRLPHVRLQQSAVHLADVPDGRDGLRDDRGRPQGALELDTPRDVPVPDVAAGLHERPPDGGEVRGEDEGEARIRARAHDLCVVRLECRGLGRNGGGRPNLGPFRAPGPLLAFNPALVPSVRSVDEELPGGVPAVVRAAARDAAEVAGAKGGLRPLRTHVLRHRVDDLPRHPIRECMDQRLGLARRGGCHARRLLNRVEADHREGQRLLLDPDFGRDLDQWRRVLLLHGHPRAVPGGPALLPGVFHLRVGHAQRRLRPRRRLHLPAPREHVDLPRPPHGVEPRPQLLQPLRPHPLQAPERQDGPSGHGIRDGRLRAHERDLAVAVDARRRHHVPVVPPRHGGYDVRPPRWLPQLGQHRGRESRRSGLGGVELPAQRPGKRECAIRTSVGRILDIDSDADAHPRPPPVAHPRCQADGQDLARRRPRRHPGLAPPTMARRVSRNSGRLPAAARPRAAGHKDRWSSARARGPPPRKWRTA